MALVSQYVEQHLRRDAIGPLHAEGCSDDFRAEPPALVVSAEGQHLGQEHPAPVVPHANPVADELSRFGGIDRHFHQVPMTGRQVDRLFADTPVAAG